MVDVSHLDLTELGRRFRHRRTRVAEHDLSRFSRVRGKPL